MRASARKGLAACAAIPVILMLIGPAAHAEEPDETTPGTTLADRIVEAAEAGATAPAELAEEVALPVDGGGSLSFDEADRIVATVVFAAAPTDADVAAVASLAVVESNLAPFPALTVRVDPAQLGALGSLPGVVSAAPALRPFTGAQLGATAGPLAAAATPAGEACGPIPIEADSPLRSAEARAQFGVDGTGVTVGVISDSFDWTDAPTSWADDVASGALPGAENPCGRATPVEIIADETGGGDEGRAMAQLVHGIAPGAKLLFADAGRSDMGMAQNIDKLVAAGADIIVDDITWPQETAYQQGFISTSIELAKAAGVAYFTSAGNSTGVGSVGASDGRPISSWNTEAYRPTACPDWLLTGDDDPLADLTDIDCLDFDPSAETETPYDTLRFAGAPGAGTVDLQVLGSIGEPAFGITTSYEWRFFEVDQATQTPTLLGAAYPLAAVLPGSFGRFNVPSGSEVRMVMVRTAHDAAAPEPAVMVNFLRGGNSLTERAHLGDGATDKVGNTTFGHAGDGSALSVASLEWDDPEYVRDYSSLGSTVLQFEPVNREAPAPAAALPAPVVAPTPNIASVDGTQTTFFQPVGEVGGKPEYRFYGTSAAAPNAAAVAALGKAYAPKVGGAELSALIQSTARGTAAGGPVNLYAAAGFADSDVFGSGIVDAVGLLSALTNAPGAPHGLRASEIGETEFTLSWDAVAAGAQLQVELYYGGVEAGSAEAAGAAASTGGGQAPLELAPDATSHVFAGLDPETAYTARVTVTNALGESASSDLSVSTLAAAVTPDPDPIPDPEPSVEPVKQAAPLAQTGGNSLPVLIAGGALLIVGAVTLAVVSARRNARRRAAEAEDGAGAGLGGPE